MQIQKVDFRYSDTDFVSFLLTLNYKFTNIEVIRDKFNKLKAFVHFVEDKETLINLQEQFKNGQSKVDPLVFSKNRRKINKLIKAELLKYQVENLD